MLCWRKREDLYADEQPALKGKEGSSSLPATPSTVGRAENETPRCSICAGMSWREAAENDEVVVCLFSLPARSSNEQPGGVRLNLAEAPALYTALFLAPLERDYI